MCRQRWTVRLGEVEPVFGQTGRVVLDITARTAHDGALKWTRAPSTLRAARSILATFPSTCALPSGGRWSLRRVLQRPGRQRKRSSAKSSCGPSRTSSSAPSSPPCCNARCAPPRLATRRAPSCATCPGGCGATAWRPSTFAPPGARRCRSRRRTTARNTPVGRSGGRDSTRTLPRLGGAGHLRPVHAEAGLRCKPRGRHAQLAGRSAGAAPLRRHRPGYQDPPLDRLSLRCAGPSGPAERGVRSAGPRDREAGGRLPRRGPRPREAQEAWPQDEEGAQPIPYRLEGTEAPHPVRNSPTRSSCAAGARRNAPAGSTARGGCSSEHGWTR